MDEFEKLEDLFMDLYNEDTDKSKHTQGAQQQTTKKYQKDHNKKV